MEKGRIAYPVHEITIAGNLKDMFSVSEAIGADTYNYGAKTVGSILINRMKVAGASWPGALLHSRRYWAAISALPAGASSPLPTPITLPMSPGPLAPSSARWL